MCQLQISKTHKRNKFVNVFYIAEKQKRREFPPDVKAEIMRIFQKFVVAGIDPSIAETEAIILACETPRKRVLLEGMKRVRECVRNINKRNKIEKINKRLF